MRRELRFTLSLFLGLEVVVVAAAASRAGFQHDGVWVDSPEQARAMVEAMHRANTNDTDHGVCYVGGYEDALENLGQVAKDAVSLSVLDVYGESEFPPLDVEASTDSGIEAYGILSACE